MEQLRNDLFKRSPYVAPGLSTKETIERIIEKVAYRFSLTVEQLKEKSRKREVVDARATAIYIIRNTMGLSWADCSYPFGKDHATAMHNYDMFETQFQVNKKFHNKVADLIS